MSHRGAFQRSIKIQTLKTHYFTLTYDCGIGSPGKAGERRRARLHTTVGCSHGDERRKYDSKRSSSHAEAYVKLQSFNITYIYTHCIYVCECSSLSCRQWSNVKCSLWLRPTTHLSLSLSFSRHPFFPFHSLLFPSSVSLNCLLCLSLFTLLMLVEGLRAHAVNVSGFKALQMSACFFFFFVFQRAKTKPRLQQICQLQVQGQVCVPYFPMPHCCTQLLQTRCSTTTLCMTQS